MVASVSSFRFIFKKNRRIKYDKYIDTSLVSKSLNQAVIHRRPSANLISHSDRGVQYTSSEYKQFNMANNMVLSMSSKGNCYDNAAMESFFHTLKTEPVFFYSYQTRQEASNSIFEYIELFYNQKRIHSTLGFMSPNEYEKRGVYDGPEINAN